MRLGNTHKCVACGERFATYELLVQHRIKLEKKKYACMTPKQLAQQCNKNSYGEWELGKN